MKNIRYEYSVVNKHTNKVVDKAFVRSDARNSKREWKEEGFDVEIIQRKFKLEQEVTIR